MSDAIIVLGRGIDVQGELSPDAASRVRKAVELYQQGAAPCIVTSGRWSYHLEVPPPRTEADAMKAYAIDLGAQPDDILCEDESLDTLGNVYFTKKRYAETRGWHTLTIVASDEHLPRANYLFQKLYGVGYTFDYVASERVLSDDEYAGELAHEQESLRISHEWLDGMADGDDAAIWQLTTERHPAYHLGTS